MPYYDQMRVIQLQRAGVFMGIMKEQYPGLVLHTHSMCLRSTPVSDWWLPGPAANSTKWKMYSISGC